MSKQILLAALLCLGTSGTALAQPAAAPQAHVPYGDLDLRRPADVHRLDRRISGAIDRVCPDARSTAPATKMAAQRCHAAQRAAVADQRARALATGGPERRVAAAPGAAATHKAN